MKSTADGLIIISKRPICIKNSGAVKGFLYYSNKFIKNM